MSACFSLSTVAFNNPSEVRETLTSIGTWDGRVEVIVVDGSCSHLVKSVVDGFQARLIQIPDDGVYFAMNNGLREARVILFSF